MRTNKQAKPLLDVINDAIGALSDLLHALRARAVETALDAKSTARKFGRAAEQTGKAALKKGKKVVRKAEEQGSGFLEKATKVWDAITNQDDDGEDTQESATARPKRRAKKAG